MKRDQRQVIQILKIISEEQKFSIQTLSDDWIVIINDGLFDLYVYGYKFPNNNAATERICDDKAGLALVLEKKGIPVVPHIYFETPYNNSYSDPEMDKQYRAELYKKWNTVVVKPNEGTGGNNVYKANSIDEVEEACEKIFISSRSCSLSPFREIENEYRVIVLNHMAKLVFEKKRPSVTGNGHDTLEKLIQDQIGWFPKEKNVNYDIIVPKDTKYAIQWKHNLGQGGTAEIVTNESLNKQLSGIASKVTKILNANFVSVDIIKSINGFEVLEVNSGVMMEHFAKASKENFDIAKSIYQDAVNSYFSSLYPNYVYERWPKRKFVLPILERNATNNDISIISDSETGAFDLLSFPNNKYFVVKDYPFNINYSGSANLCKNKGACSYFLNKLGFSVPMEKYFIKHENIWETIKEVSKWLKEPEINLGFSYPIILKPNSLSQGTGVYRIDNYDEGIEALKMIRNIPDRVFLLQQYVPGCDCRIVVLQGRIIQAYERIPFSIEGNGVDSIEKLLKKKINLFTKANRDKYVDITDARISKKLQKEGYTLESVIEPGVVIKLQDVCNLSLGGHAEDIEKIITEKIKNTAIDVARKLNLAMCGIDMIIRDLKAEEYSIIEVNSAPGLDNYLYSGEMRENYLDNIYEKVLMAIKNTI